MKTKRSAKRIFGKILILVLASIAALLIAAPFLGVAVATTGHIDYGVREHPLQKVYTASYFGLETNDFYLTTDDGYRIWTSELEVDNPKAVILYLTGIRQPSVTYYYGHAKWMQAHGYGSFLLEVRGHGKSDGDKVCLGYDETADVRALLDYIHAQERYREVPIVIQGVSMGGAIAVNSFGLYDDIDGLIAASAYSSFDDTICSVLRRYHVPNFLCDLEQQLLRLALRLSFGEKADEITPVVQAANIGDRPALFIASADDPEVPPDNLSRLLAAAPPHCEHWLRDEPETGHFILLNHEFEDISLDTEYCEKILGFLERNFA